jgi:hypothetical protein
MLIDSHKLRYVTEYGAYPHGINIERFLRELPCYHRTDISDHDLAGTEPTDHLIRQLRVVQYREIKLCHLLS